MNYSELFKQFLLSEKNYSELTASAYLADIKQFFNLIIKEENAVNEEDIREYLIKMMQLKVSKRSLTRKLSALRCYYKFLNYNYDLPINPFINIEKMKVAIPLPQFLYLDEVDKLLDASLSDDLFTNYRDQLILELLFSCGLRVSEAANLALNNIDTDQELLKILGKGNKWRYVPYTDILKNKLDKYLSYRPLVNKNNEQFLLLSLQGRHLTIRAIQLIVKKYGAIILGKELHPHMLRHSYATALINNGADIRLVQELLGHSSLKTTQIYTHISAKYLREAIINAHPRNKKN